MGQIGKWLQSGNSRKSLHKPFARQGLRLTNLTTKPLTCEGRLIDRVSPTMKRRLRPARTKQFKGRISVDISVLLTGNADAHGIGHRRARG